MTNTSNARVAVIGCGHWGKNLIKNFAALGALDSVYDKNAEAAGLLAQQHGVTVSTWRDILDNASIDGVVIAAPAVLHAELALQVLEKGKHVFIEKPLAMTVAEGEKILVRAQQVGRLVMVGHILNYHEAFIKLKELVTSGQLGAVRHVQSTRFSLGKIRHEEDVLWSFSPHDISMVLSLVGSEPMKMWTHGDAFLQKDIADINTLMLDFPGQQKAVIQASWCHPYKEQRLIVTGEKATAVFDDVKPWGEKLAIYKNVFDKTNVPPTIAKSDVEYVALEQKEPLLEECRHFLNSIESGFAPLTDGKEGLRVLRVLENAINLK